MLVPAQEKGSLRKEEQAGLLPSVASLATTAYKTTASLLG